VITTRNDGSRFAASISRSIRLAGAIRERLRRVRQDLRVDSVEALQAVGDVAGRREDLPRLAERNGIEPLDGGSGCTILGRL
jgi:hypothetical protein